LYSPIYLLQIVRVYDPERDMCPCPVQFGYFALSTDDVG